MTASTINGHATPSAKETVAPAPEVGTSVEIDPKKLGIDGHKLLASLETLQKWALMFGTYRDRAIDLAERRVLGDVVAALEDDMERVKLALTQFAIRRGAAKLTSPDDESAV